MKESELANLIIDYQVKNHVNDTVLAFQSHLSVEKIHAMKLGKGQFTNDEIQQIYDYLSSKS